jgi:Flp pilus assembly protein CpaB
VYHSTHSSPIRTAAMSSGTLFGITLAIVAGLVVATGVKLFILDRATPPVVKPAMREITVAAYNILDKTKIGPKDVKRVQIAEEDLNKWIKRAKDDNTEMLRGTQPISRTTVKPLKAEEPIFENRLEPMSYPEPVSDRLAEGMRAIVVETPAKETMVQVLDHVDLVATIKNTDPAFGNPSTYSAPLVKNARVVARFGSTATGIRPGEGDTRTYTLEVSPFRYALIELAKAVGAKFNLSVAKRTEEKENGVAPAALSEREKSEVATTKHLAEAFGLKEPPKVKKWDIETYYGTKKGQTIEYTGYDAALNRVDPNSTGDVQRQLLGANARARQPRAQVNDGFTAPTATNTRQQRGQQMQQQMQQQNMNRSSNPRSRSQGYGRTEPANNAFASVAP